MRAQRGPAAVAPAPASQVFTRTETPDDGLLDSELAVSPPAARAELPLRSFDEPAPGPAAAAAANAVMHRKWAAHSRDGDGPDRPAARSPAASSDILCSSVSAATMRRLIEAPLYPLEGDLRLSDSPLLLSLMKIVGAVPPSRSRVLNGVHVVLVLLLAALAPVPWTAIYVVQEKPFHVPAAVLGGTVMVSLCAFSIWYYRSTPHGPNVIALAARLLRSRRREAARRTMATTLLFLYLGLAVSQTLLTCWWIFSTRGYYKSSTWLPVCIVSVATVSIVDIGAGLTIFSFALQTSLFVACYQDITEEIGAPDAEEGALIRGLESLGLRFLRGVVFPAVAELVTSTEAAWGPFLAPVTGVAGMAFAYMAYVFYDATRDLASKIINLTAAADAEQDFVILCYALAMASISGFFLVSAARVTSAAAGVRDAAGRYLMPGAGRGRGAGPPGPPSAPAPRAPRAQAEGPAERAAVRFLHYFGSREQGFRVLGVLVTKSLLSRVLYLLLSAAGLLLRLALNRSL
eukprot:tig00021434_g21376.t1